MEAIIGQSVAAQTETGLPGAICAAGDTPTQQEP
jgi:hypothetical protein